MTDRAANPADLDGAPTVVAMLKAPRPGLVKTRLARDLGPDRAADAYRRLVERQMAAIPAGWRTEIHFAPADAESEMQRWLGPGHAWFPQADGDLGERMAAAVAGAFDRRAPGVLVIGGDCPSLDGPSLREAWQTLRAADIVLGPARDGGYYLLGLRQPNPRLFGGIPWSTPGVFAATLGRIRETGLRYAILPAKADVDDLAGWRDAEPLLSGRPNADHAPPSEEGARLCVIIPALDEADFIGKTLERVRTALPHARAIVADGGSADRTISVATDAGALAISSERGRGIQCRAGAAHARADWLLFLHADTLLPPDAGRIVADFADDSAHQIATFGVCFEGCRPQTLLARLARFDSVFTRFGDQGILVRRSFYQEIGGFPPWPLFEDVALLQQARKRTRIHWLPATVITSSRRFRRRGLLRQNFLNAGLLLRYLAGASPFALAARYRGKG